MGFVKTLEAVEEEEVGSLEEARNLLQELRAVNKRQAHLLLSWKKRLKDQSLLLLQAQRNKSDCLEVVQCQLFLLESQMRRRQKELQVTLKAKDDVIKQQQRLLLVFAEALSKKEMEDKGKGSPLGHNSSKSDPESLNDSDSAIMMEENFEAQTPGEITVVRSVSDAVQCAVTRCSSGTSTSSGVSSPGSSTNMSPPASLSSSSFSSEESDESPGCTLSKGRAELLRTVYSQEEELVYDHKVASEAPKFSDKKSNYEAEALSSDAESDEDDAVLRRQMERRQLLGSYEKLNCLNSAKPVEEIFQVTYNRVMSNHRSVTKPKDVKYKRINKARSRSLEELRGKLRLWDGKHSISVDMSHSFA